MNTFGRPVETEEQKENRLYPWVNCCLCKKRERARYGEPIRMNMIQRKLCFKCDFWSEHLLNFILHKGTTPEGGKIVICQRFTVEGHPISQYIAYPYSPTGYDGMVGFGGATFYFLAVGGKPFRTNNMWHQGEIPEHFREFLPINATEITEEKYFEYVLTEEFEQSAMQNCQGSAHTDLVMSKILKKHHISTEHQVDIAKKILKQYLSAFTFTAN